jgi:hypothetical protein
MTPWLALSLGLWLGQTPQVTPSLPPDADTQDPAALELREAWERALDEFEATDAGEAPDGTVQMPVMEIGAPDSAITVPVAEGVPRGGADSLTAPAFGGSGTDTGTEAPPTEGSAPAATPQAPATGDLRQELDRLRTQLDALQSQLQAQQEASAARTQALQESLTGMQERAQELERLRAERLELLERAGLWLLAADQALAVGELDVGDALNEADSALADVLQNASEAGSGQAVLLVESARSRIAYALEATGRRDTYDARWSLYFASLELRQARQRALDRPDTSVVIP